MHTLNPTNASKTLAHAHALLKQKNRLDPSLIPGFNRFGPQAQAY